MPQPITTHPDSGLPVYHDVNGEIRHLGTTPPNPIAKGKLGAFRDFLNTRGIAIIPRVQLKPIDNRSVFDDQYILNQNSHGSCVGFSAAGAMMRRRFACGYTYAKLSGAYIYSWINGGYDSGANITDALNALEQHGTCLDSTVPWNVIYRRQTAVGDAEAARFTMRTGLIISSYDEMLTAVALGYYPQFPIQVGGNFENFDSEGCAGVSRGSGNHSVHADGIKLGSGGEWLLDMPNSWGTRFGTGGRCYLREAAIEDVASRGDAYVHVDENMDPQDPNNPPAPIN